MTHVEIMLVFACATSVVLIIWRLHRRRPTQGALTVRRHGGDKRGGRARRNLHPYRGADTAGPLVVTTICGSDARLTAFVGDACKGPPAAVEPFWLVAQHGGVIVGAVRAWFIGDPQLGERAVADVLTVQHGYRARGVGNALLSRLLEEARCRRGRPHIQLPARVWHLLCFEDVWPRQRAL